MDLTELHDHGIYDGIHCAGAQQRNNTVCQHGVAFTAWAHTRTVIDSPGNIMLQRRHGILITPVWMYSERMKLLYDTESIMRWLNS